MKIKKIIPPIMAFLCVSLLASCDVNDGFGKEDFDYLKKVVNANIETTEEHEDTYVKYEHALSKSLKEYHIVNSNYAQDGLLVVSNAIGRIGVYNTFYNHFIYGCRAYATDYDIRVYHSLLTNLVYIRDGENTFLMDTYGYLFLDNDITSGLDIRTKFTNEGDPVLSISNNEIVSNYTYSDYKTPTIYHGEVNDGVSIDNDISTPDHVNDLLSSKKVMIDSSYLAGYYVIMANNGVVTLFDNSGTVVQTYYLPETSSPILIGDKIIYQKVTALDKKAESYTFISRGTPCALTTKVIDLRKNSESQLDVNYVISNAEPIKDENGQTNNAIAVLSKINDDKTLGPEKEYVINSNLEVLSECTNLYLKDFHKTKHGYYNSTNNLLYDDELNIIMDFGDDEPTYNLAKDMFVFKNKDGNYNIYNSQGERVGENYQDIIMNEDAPLIVIKQYNDYYSVDTSTGSDFSNLPRNQYNNFELLDRKNGIFIADDNLYNLEGEIGSDITINDNFTRTFAYFKKGHTVLDKDRAAFTYGGINNTLYNIDIGVSFQDNPVSNNYPEIGYDDLEQYTYNYDISISNSYTQFAFTPSDNVTLYNNDDSAVIVRHYYPNRYESEEMWSDESFYMDYKNLYYFTKGEKYIITAVKQTNNYTEAIDLKFYCHGSPFKISEHTSYGSFNKRTNNSYEFFNNGYDSSMDYLYIAPQLSGNLRIEISSSTFASGCYFVINDNTPNYNGSGIYEDYVYFNDRIDIKFYTPSSSNYTTKISSTITITING